MKIKIIFITVLLMCFAFSLACRVNLGNNTKTDSTKSTKKDVSEEKGSEDPDDSKEVAKKEEKSEKNSVFQNDNDPVGGTKADEYYTDTYLDQDGGRIRFKRGESSAVINGKIKNGKEVTYIIGAKTRQTLYINLTDQGEANDVVFQLIAPNGQTAGEEGDELHTTWRGELPQDGDYKIVFGTFESENTNFTFLVSIE